jgi:hypothetical protein
LLSLARRFSLEFGAEELKEIDQLAQGDGIDLWREISLL